jgi:hypothetical protein
LSEGPSGRFEREPGILIEGPSGRFEREPGILIEGPRDTSIAATSDS